MGKGQKSNLTVCVKLRSKALRERRRRQLDEEDAQRPQHDRALVAAHHEAAEVRAAARAELELPSDTTPLDVLLRAEEELGTQVEAGSSLVQRAERAAAELGV